MNAQPEPLEMTSLTDLITAANQADARAHRRTLIVTIGIACAALVAILIWSFALRNAAEESNRQAEKAKANYQLALSAATMQLDKLQYLTANGGVTASAARALLAPLGGTLGRLDKVQNSPDITKTQVRLLLTISDTYADQGDQNAAYRSADTARVLAEQLSSDGNADAPSLIFDATWRIGDQLTDAGRFTEADREFERALQIASEALSEKPSDLSWQNSLSFILIKIGDVNQLAGRYDLALEAYQRALEIYTKSAQADSGNVGLLRNVARARMRLGQIFTSSAVLPQPLRIT